MRDAFGGVFMFRLTLVIIFIFVDFTAISLNYAKAFRIKNSIIDLIEEEEVFDLDDVFASADNRRLRKLNAILDNAKYNKQCQNVDTNGEITREAMDGKAYCYRGVIIEQVGTAGAADDIIIYNVSTYAAWDLKIFNLMMALGGQDRNSKYVVGGAWKITGEARVVKRNYDK